MLPAVNTPLKLYLYVLLWLWIASLGVPLPEDIALLSGGFFCYQYEGGVLDVSLMIAVSMFGVLSGDLLVFYLGHRWSSSLLEHRLTRRLATPERLAALRRQFHRHQIKTVFVGRFLPGMRMLVFLTAGAMKMRTWKFLLVNGTAALISVPVFVGMGYLFGHSFEQVKKGVQHAEHVIVLIALIGAAIWLIWHSVAKSARAREAARLLKDAEPDPTADGAVDQDPTAAVRASEPQTAPRSEVEPARAPASDRPMNVH